MDDMQHDGMTNSEMEMYKWKYGYEKSFVKNNRKQFFP